MAFYVLFVPFFATPVLSGSAQRVLSQTEMGSPDKPRGKNL
jgi:hypothetical protein